MAYDEMAKSIKAIKVNLAALDNTLLFQPERWLHALSIKNGNYSVLTLPCIRGAPRYIPR